LSSRFVIQSRPHVYDDSLAYFTLELEHDTKIFMSDCTITLGGSEAGFCMLVFSHIKEAAVEAGFAKPQRT
jgi:hypothetical protein